MKLPFSPRQRPGPAGTSNLSKRAVEGPVLSPSRGSAPSPPMAHPDLSIVERCRANEPGAFEELYRTHAPRLFGVACRLVGRAEAEDLLQEIFLTAHRKLGLFKGESSIGTWLFMWNTVLPDFLSSFFSYWNDTPTNELVLRESAPVPAPWA